MNMNKPLTIIALTLLSICHSFAQSEFSQWRGPQRDGTYPEVNLLESWPSGGPRLLWKYDRLGVGYSSVAATGSRVFTVGTIDSISHLFCFDPKGALLWKTRLGLDFMGEYSGTYSTPVISAEMGYVVNGLGVLYCFSSSNGQIIWSKDLIREFKGIKITSGFLDNLIVDGDLIICAPGGAERNIVALKRASGALVWESKGTAEVSGFSSPVLADHKGQKYYIYQDTSSILALNVADGTLAWKHPRGCGTLVGTLFFHDGFLFNLTENGSVLLKLADGHNPPVVAWSHPEFFPLQGDPVLVGNRLYGKSKGKKYLSIDWTTGRTIGSIPTKAMVVTSVAADGLIYVYDIDGIISLFKPVESGMETMGSFKVEGGSKYHCSHPVISGGKLYIRHDNSLFVYDVSKGNQIKAQL